MLLLGVCRPCRRYLSQGTTSRGIRNLSTQITSNSTGSDEGVAPPSSSPRPANVPPAYLSPDKVYTPNQEAQLKKKYGLQPIGSRRRRNAVRLTQRIPFEQLPYQCFQEALTFLQQDRQEKLAEIETQRGRIQRLKDQEPQDEKAARMKEHRLSSMGRHLEYLKIQADINDPLVKRRFEDNNGDMNRPIYRFLARRKWESRKKLITEQRINQMHIVPDLLPSINITADVDLMYTGKNDKDGKTILPRVGGQGAKIRVMPGQFVSSIISMQAPSLRIQVFTPGDRLVTIAAVDPDVPNVETNGFDTRCIFLAVNIPISQIPTTLNLKAQPEEQTILPWSPPFAHKGAPYHRIAFLIFEQNKAIDVAKAAEKVQRDGFMVRAFADRHGLRGIGAHLFRTLWDEWMQKVMRQAGIPGAELEFKHKPVEPLPRKRRDSERFR